MPRHAPPVARRHCPLHGLHGSYELAWIDYVDEFGNGVSIPTLCAEWMGLPSRPALTMRLEDDQWARITGHEHAQETHALHIHPGERHRSGPRRGP